MSASRCFEIEQVVNSPECGLSNVRLQVLIIVSVIRTTPGTSSHLSINRVSHGVHALIVLFCGIVGNQLTIANNDSRRLLVARIKTKMESIALS